MAAGAALPAGLLVLGIDPGTKHTGYGLVKSSGGAIELVVQGRLSPPTAWPLPRRLAHIYDELNRLVAGYRPVAVAVEDIFIGLNARSALRLGHVRGVALLAAAQNGAEVFEYPPRLVKNAVAGYGQADKAQVAHMVGELLHLKETLAPDAADALAVALCHLGQCRLDSLLPGQVKPARSGGRSGWRNLSEADLTSLNYGGK